MLCVLHVSKVPYLPYTCTVNSEIFQRVLFSQNFGHGKFPDNKTILTCHLLMQVNNAPVAYIFNISNMSLNVIAKSTVYFDTLMSRHTYHKHEQVNVTT